MVNGLLDYRNIGIMAHIDAGKTTVTERILFYTGKLYKMGEVHEGNTAMDWMPQEKERGITISSASTTCYWFYSNYKYQINIIDTPGHVDFTIEVERSLRILDGAVAVFDSVSGVEAQSETVWRQADKYNLSRLCFVNKMDKIGADFYYCIHSIRSKFQVTTLNMQLPIVIRNKFVGIYEFLCSNVYLWTLNSRGTTYAVKKFPNLLINYLSAQRTHFIDSLLEYDDCLLDDYFSCQILNVSDIKKSIRNSVLNNLIFPVLCGSAFRNIAVQHLLNSIVNFLPNPKDKFRSIHTTLLCAFAFKIVNDSFVGTLTFVRLYSGSIKVGDIVFNTTKKKKERISRILIMHSNIKQDVNACREGDIVALAGLKFTLTGDTLSHIGSHIILEKILYPDPLMVVAVEPQTKQDQEKMLLAIGKLISEDPSIHVSTDIETNQTKLGGMGELHLEIFLDRMKRQFNINADMGAPQVSYRETIEGSYTVEYLHKKQSGGSGQFARVKILFEKSSPNSGYIFESKIVGGNIPKEYIPSIKKAILYASKQGVLCGYPLVDFKAVLLDGSYHDVDSSAFAFEIASKIAFRKGIAQASPVLLEPIMLVEILTVDSHIGDVIGHLSSIRGKVLSMCTKLNTKIITARVPLSSMFGYVNILRSMTQGRSHYSMKFYNYSKVPPLVLNKIVKNKY